MRAIHPDIFIGYVYNGKISARERSNSVTFSDLKIDPFGFKVPFSLELKKIRAKEIYTYDIP
jgi:hypothetical protein